MKHSRKGHDVNVPMWLILGIFILLIFIFFNSSAAGQVKKWVPFLQTCTDRNGECHKVNDCSQLTDNAYLTDTARCEDKNEVCCIKDKSSPYYTPPANNPKCENKVEGDNCGTYELCMVSKSEGNLECVPKCDYCASKPTDSKCAITTVQGKLITRLDGDFKCQCTLVQCNALTRSSDNSCVPNFCPSNSPTAGDYRCCDIAP